MKWYGALSSRCICLLIVVMKVGKNVVKTNHAILFYIKSVLVWTNTLLPQHSTFFPDRLLVMFDLLQDAVVQPG